ncbi:MAG: urease accessory protein UreE [Verrucomicrobiota bacterium]|nr:urease accessory protein UreE [Verrucomicrobiota bacterium]
MLHLIQSPLAQFDPALPEVALRVERLTLAKRLWRGKAEDGAEFGFELGAPLKDGDTVWQTKVARYVIRQNPEPVLEISLDVAPSAAAGIGWAIGNLHMELCAEPTRLLTPDDTATRQLLNRLAVPYRATTAIFRPGRFARGSQLPHELGPSHKH